MRLLACLALTLAPVSAFAGAASYDVKIDGMTCGHCADAVKAALLKLPQADQKSVQVVLMQKKATLNLKDDNQEAVSAVKKAVEGAGFRVVAMNRLTGVPK